MSGNEHVLVFTRARDSRAFIMHHPFREAGNNFFRGRVPDNRNVLEADFFNFQCCRLGRIERLLGFRGGYRRSVSGRRRTGCRGRTYFFSTVFHVPPVREPRTIGRRIDKQKTQSKEYDKYKNKAESFSKLGTAFTPWLITVGLVSTPDNRAYVLLVQMAEIVWGFHN